MLLKATKWSGRWRLWNWVLGKRANGKCLYRYVFGPLAGCNKFNEHARAQLKSKQIYYAPFEQRINLTSGPTAVAAAVGVTVTVTVVAVGKINIPGQKRLTAWAEPNTVRLGQSIDVACVQRAWFKNSATFGEHLRGLVSKLRKTI